MTMDDNKIFIVMPAYNEAKKILEIARRVTAIYPNLVIVDDGSTDGTAEIISHEEIYLLRHIVNRGQGAALQTGIKFALNKGADIIVTFDSDGQHDEIDIEALIQPIINEECDVTLGSRFMGHTENMPFTRMVLLKLGVLFTRFVSRIDVSDVHNGLRAFSRQAARSLNIRMDRMAHASEILDQIKQMGWRYREIPVTIHYSVYSLAKGQSSWNALKIAFQLFTKKTSR